MKTLRVPKLNTTNPVIRSRMKNNSKLEKLTERFFGLNKCCAIKTSSYDKFDSLSIPKNILKSKIKDDLKSYVKSRLAKAYYDDKYTMNSNLIANKPDKFLSLIKSNQKSSNKGGVLQITKKAPKTKLSKNIPINKKSINNNPKESKISSKIFLLP
jgi:hypothetical protein